MSILNVNQIQPVGSGQTITISASDITASSATITASSVTANLTGDVTGNLTGNVTGNVTSSSTSTFSSGLNVTGGKVGIGTNSAIGHLDVRDASGSDPTISIYHSNADVEGECIRLGRTDLPTIRYHSIKAKHSGGATSNYIKFDIHDSSGSVTDQSEIMRLVGNGNVQIANGNLVFSTSGTGIDFSATSDGSGTTTSELLDDYEEGLWTPQVTQGVSGTPTYEYQLGWYTKIGRIVTTYFYIKFASSGNTGSNSIFRVGNLPFPVVSTNNGTLQRGMGVSNYHSIPGFTSSNVSFYGGGNSNTFASVYQGNNSVATSSAVNSQYIIGGFEYISE